MVFKLFLNAEKSWRKLNGHDLVSLVRAGVSFIDGVRAERDTEAGTNQPSGAKSKTKTKHAQDPKVAA